jgi:hypothetical protein
MKKALLLFVLAVFVTAPSFARYIVVLKDGTRYAAKEKWKVVNGKAIVLLENGQSLQLDPSLIDGPRSEQMTKVGMANANIVDLNPTATAAQPKQNQPSLGSQIKLRQRPDPSQTAPATPSATTPATPASGGLSAEVLDKFDRAFDNVGIFEKKVIATAARGIRADLTVDTEERVFNAISAASFLMVRNAGVDGAQIEMVEMFMKTTTGGSAGRFQMTRADAEALDKRTISQQDYFVQKVIY